MSDKRVPNFSISETELLISLVKKFSNILENKKTDAINNQLKEQTWSKLADEFNSTSGLHLRSAKNLRAKYENIKKSLKRKYAEHRRSMYGTGGGPSTDVNFTSDEQVIIELAGPSIEGLPARHDSDEITLSQQPQLSIEEVRIDPTNEDTKSEVVMSTTDQITTATTVCSKNTPERFILRKRKATPLRQRNPESFNSTMDNYSELSKKKKELVDIQIKHIEQKMVQEKIEHELRCAKFKADEKEQDLRCQLLQYEILLKEKMLKE